MNNIKPNHYKMRIKGVDIEVQDIMKEVNSEQFKGFCYMNVLKYVLRAEKKNGIEDYKKANYYLKKYIELLEKENEDE